MAFTIQTLRSALGVVQDLHTKAVANNDELMISKWGDEIARLTAALETAKKDS